MSGNRVLGIDPGSILVGYGCVEIQGRELKTLTHGTLKLSTHNDGTPMEQRLLTLFEGISALIEQFRPQALAVEKVFFAKNAASALKLGQARGVIVLAAAQAGLQIAEYNATEVKKALTGSGRAEKEQVSKMLQIMTGQKDFQTLDASDALALAVCHANQIRDSFSSRVMGRSLKDVAREAALKQERGIAQRAVDFNSSVDIDERNKR